MMLYNVIKNIVSIIFLTTNPLCEDVLIITQLVYN